ncbi:unnamed protein product [Scytosiphon promiscuus]
MAKLLLLLAAALLRGGALAEEDPTAPGSAAAATAAAAATGATGPLGKTSPKAGDDGESVYTFDAQSLDAALQEGGRAPLMVEFYAPWCGHCKKLEPEYAMAAKDLEKDGLLVGKVNCDANESLCDEDRWDLEGFPAIKVIRGGLHGPIHDYGGPRLAGDIAAFMRQVAALPPPEDAEGDVFDDDDDDAIGRGDEEDDEEYHLDEDDGVLILGDHNFDVATDRFILMLVLLHTPGCEGCGGLLQEYVEAADELYDYMIPAAKVDCFLQAELCQQPRWSAAAAKAALSAGGNTATDDLGIGAKEPTLFVVRDGEVIAYGGAPPFRAFDMVEFAKELAGISGDYDDDDEGGDGEEEDGDDVDETNVLSLDGPGLELAVKDDGVLLLEFFAPWCGNCKRLRPRYARAADALAKEGSPARLAKIDCTEHEALCASEPWKISKFPTMMLRRYGKLYEFDGAPEAKDIVQYVRKATEPALQPLAGLIEVDDFIGDNEVAVVGIMEKEGSEAYLKFKEAAEADFGRAYGVSYDDEVAAYFGVSSGNKVVVFRHFDQEKLSMHVFSFTKPDGIEAFVLGAARRLYLKMGTEEASEVLIKRPLAMFILTEEDRAPSKATRAMMELAQTMAKDALYASAKKKSLVGGEEAGEGEHEAQDERVVHYVHASMDDAGSRVMDFLVGEENREENLPGIFLVAPGDDGKAIKYRYDGEEFTAEGLQEFERRYFAGELRPHLKTEALSPSDEAGALKTVKAASFERIVIENEHDVLVAFYAPWCPHCRRLGPIYEELATKMEGRDKLVVAHMDVMANDVDYPGISVSKLPTIAMFKAGSKDHPEIYDGELELEPLEAFIEGKVDHGPGPGGNDGTAAGSTASPTALEGSAPAAPAAPADALPVDEL